MIEGEKRRVGLADFLKSRRARLRPEEFDLPVFQRRRTPGLRREELAQLVGVGVSWYTWLEQGRDIQVSDHVLERLASILRLNEEEHRHLLALARGPVSLLNEQGSESHASNAAIQAVLDGFIYPVRLFDRRLNVVGWNESANRVFGDYARRSERERNATWFHFIDPSSRELHVHWERDARRCLAFLRVKYDQYPDDAWLAELIADLQQASPEFRAWWPEHDVRLTCGSLYEINHPQVGRLALQPSTLIMPTLPDVEMVVYTPLPGGDTAARLDALSSLVKAARS